MKLVKPSLEYKESYLKALERTQHETQETRLFRPDDNQSFEEFVQLLYDRAKGINVPPKFVASSTFWLVDNGEIIGRVHIRHTLNEMLKKEGGHIGYYIVPWERNKGYGKMILKLGIQEAKKIGIKKILVTCDDYNIGSQKVIEANGGILQDVIASDTRTNKVMRYWIDAS